MSTTLAAISPLFDALGRVPFIAGVLTKGTLIVLIAACLTRLLGRSPAAARHLVWSLSVGGLLLLPVMTQLPWRLELTTLAAARDAFAPAPPADPVVTERMVRVAKNDHAMRAVPSPASVNDASNLPSPQSPVPSPRSSVPSPRALNPATILTLIWLAGIAWMAGRLLVGVANVRRMVRRSVPADDDWQELVDHARACIGAETEVRIVISAEAAMPFTSGLLRPVIVLPDSATDWTMERRRSVLLHELAHVRRRDLVTNAVVQVACAVYWFHPLVRLAARHVRIEAERACDALVVAAGTRPSDYAGDLLEIARTMRSSATATVALAMARRSDFEGRLLAILSPDAGRNVLTATRAALVALSFAAPAVAIGAAVPAAPAVPNADVRNTNRVEATAPSVASHEADVEPTASVAGVAEHALQDVPTVERQAPAQKRDTAVPALLSVLKDENAAVRLAAIQSLGNLSDPRAVDALVEAVKTDTDPQVREAAAEALGEIDSPRAVPGLIAALGSEKVGAVRAKIAWALGEIDDKRAVAALGAVVRDPDAEVRRQAVSALGELESAAAVPMLIPALKDADIETRKQAASALGEIGSKDAVEALIPLTKDADAEVRKQTVEALGQIEDKRALPALEAAVRDANVEVRRQAIEAIGQLDELRSAPPALITALKDDDQEVRKAAVEALGQLEDEEAVPALIPLTRDADVEVKRAAVEALSSIGGARAVEVMAGLLKDGDPEIRKIAAEALGKKR
jgi:HEAT repeat protein/beta-lactamase regulating signal transducer with metallopeptidase domain